MTPPVMPDPVAIEPVPVEPRFAENSNTPPGSISPPEDTLVSEFFGMEVRESEFGESPPKPSPPPP